MENYVNIESWRVHPVAEYITWTSMTYLPYRGAVGPFEDQIHIHPYLLRNIKLHPEEIR
jgi:hypothetical protein